MEDRELVYVPLLLEPEDYEALKSQLDGETGEKEITVNLPFEGVEKLKRRFRGDSGA
ncbi:MAG: hypothetical protein SVV03_02590 [Candidatus Nanohaloarchaea archaeon]|nr:hypothetical protein [Candidatus Nanohaloarchaea archaeon]